MTIFDEKNKKIVPSSHKDIVVGIFYTVKERKYLSIRFIYLYKYIYIYRKIKKGKKI